MPPRNSNQLEEAADRHFDAGVAAGLVRVDGRRFGLDGRIEREADRHAVFGVVVADRNADVEVAVDIGDAAGNDRRSGRRCWAACP